LHLSTHMLAFPASLRFPYSRVLLPRTRLAYIHLRNLLTDAKRDRAARISGYVAVSLPDELVMLYLVGGEVANATVRLAHSARPVAIASALELVPHEPEYGEICFHEAEQEQLACMFATHAIPTEPWPAGMSPQDPAALFPYLMSTTFDGFVEIIANEGANYLIFRNGAVVRAYLAMPAQGRLVDRVAQLFNREGRSSELRVARWGVPGPLPVQAAPALVQAYRELASTLVRRLAEAGRAGAPDLAERARQTLVATHPVLDCFAFDGRETTEPLSDTRGLTAGVAAWIREVMWTAADQEAAPPDALFRELTWDRRHMFQSAGLFDQMPWKVL
jgi:hypothetical protein